MLNELILLVALQGATWEMTPQGVPELCLRSSVSDSEQTSQESKVCTQVPEELLLKWLKEATVKV